jgi:hypothetical protein
VKLLKVLICHLTRVTKVKDDKHNFDFSKGIRGEPDKVLSDNWLERVPGGCVKIKVDSDQLLPTNWGYISPFGGLPTFADMPPTDAATAFWIRYTNTTLGD